MIKFYFHPGPNPMKIALFLEETGLEFELVPVDTLKGEQHSAEFKAINPNSKTPAIEDNGVRVFDSNAILLYLADKTGQLAATPENRGELLSWLMFVATGLGPYSGQCVHFTHHAPEKIDYATNRYLRETQRHYQVLDAHLNNREFIVGDELSIVDIAAWGWVDKVGYVLGQDALATYPNIQRWFNSINNRPAVERARDMGKDIQFKAEFDEDAKRAFFPQNYAV
ncbi:MULTISPECIES: glutathione S-transferase family protein [Shewanella]|jgi:GST-like protein|uniref:Glutathione S-transferase, N-terminal domain protein n=2 Tax=Shewanella frigidimarina TaxID=56812 RepID=Q081R1_SHEFN|nr:MULTISPECIES: glutathione binding-like protein [Shewanella]ABI72004.1 Glutathione S-transferase, N-terminal domain protein [Shewanella frigidimarina NCIMB 400]KVX03184.1 glutathione S-transferase [Shewanella frigidimarina]PKI07890.1 glutathione S-transferase [Shewanella sp. 11B5]|tara:strand:+ start:526 stop:1200 length:675 start_codon:yes stop_codon:yes gene_type:complete